MRRRSGDERPAIVDPEAAASEALRTLRLALQLQTNRRGNCALFTSAEPGVGKTTLAGNYALVSSLGHSRVLLIDADLRKPSMHDVFSVPRAPGLVDLLADGSNIPLFAHRVAAFGQLDVLTAGREIRRSGDIVASKRMGELLELAAKQYDVVVVDSPPVLRGADAEGLASHGAVDVLFVVQRSTRKRLIRKALRRLELIDANVAGIIVNRQGRAVPYPY